MAVLHRNISFSFLLAAALGISAFICNIVAFATPYWVRAWPRLYSKFDKVGLWQVCLNGYVHPHDWTMKSYVGCWWILSDEFLEVRFWLLPAWFVFCQIVMTLALIFDLLICVLSIAMLVFRILSKSGSYHRGLHGRFAPTLLKMAAAFAFMSLVFILTACVLVWIYSMDPYWMPAPNINKMSWSYGLALLSCFFNGFCGISYIFVHRGLYGIGNKYQETTDEPPRMPEPRAAST